MPILVEVVQKYSLPLYYIDAHDVDLEDLDVLNEYLEEDDGGQKRLYVPDVYFIKDGVVETHHLGTVDSYNNAFQGMNEEQRNELKEIYQEGCERMIASEK